MHQAILILSYVLDHIGEHAGPVIILGGSGDSFRDAEMAGSGIVVYAAQDFGSSVSWYTLFPLFIGGDFLEIYRV